MRKLFALICFITFLFNAKAQEKGEFRAGINLGYTMSNPGIGFNGDVDCRYNIEDNANIGVRFGLTGLGKNIVKNSYNEAVGGIFSGMSSILVISDYYLNKKMSEFAPFIGLGLGAYNILNIKIDNQTNSAVKIHLNDYNGDKKLAFNLHGGFEYERLRVALDINLIAKSTLLDINNRHIGTTKNNHFSLSVGYRFGGGNWRKKTTPNIRRD